MMAASVVDDASAAASAVELAEELAEELDVDDDDP